MLVGNATTPATTTRADGTVAVQGHQALTVEQARLLRDYQAQVLRPMHLRRELRCNGCGSELQAEVNHEFVALSCDCTLRTFSGPSAVVATDAPREPEHANVIVSPDGQAAARYLLPVSESQVRLLRDYKAKVLLALRLRESTFCDRCFASSAISSDGVRFVVTPALVEIVCRCTERHYRGVTA